MIGEAELAHLRGWIGRSERGEDVVASELVRRFRATFDEAPGAPETGEPAPLGIHWCLSPAVAPASALGPDGHPARGGFLPPIPLPRRMWAGGALMLVDPLRVGDAVARISRIADVQAKSGKSGLLCFVTVEHTYETARGPAIVERQDIVYREADTGRAHAPTPAPPPTPPEPGARREAFPTDPVLLFRYSALTFNGHRIHYDPDYARHEEGYAGLVVHGPLQATALLRFAAETMGQAPARFSFRGLSPLIAGRPAFVNAAGEGDSRLWIDDGEGRRSMTGEAEA